MKWVRKTAGLGCVLALLLGLVGGINREVAAESPARLTKILVSYTEYTWWLISWQSNQIACVVLTDHEGLPTYSDVVGSCGEELADYWYSAPPCKAISKNGNSANCTGLYLHMVSSQPKEREVIIQLPLPVVFVNLDGCTPVPPENRCPVLPNLLFKGEEPLPNERIVAIQGSFNGEPFFCPGDTCLLPLRPTPVEGLQLEFWADSSFGDSSEHFTAQVRVIDTGVSPAPGSSGWFVDIISSQWQGAPLASCAQIWEAFPPIGGSPAWLTTPESFELLASAEPYYYLAGRLIHQGIIDASVCPSGGLLPNGYADTCGLEIARPLVDYWQNQFDHRIIEVAKETGIPAQLMKNLFAQESQFWAGIFRVPFEFGLGQLTDNGADTILLWTPSFFNQFCPLVLDETACASGYLGLRPEEQAMLRGAVALQAQADCPSCPQGIDLSNVNFTVSLFANILQANCAQVSRTIYTATNQMAGWVSSYEDLWRYTIANYHAGPGCLSYAIHQTWQSTGSINWEEVSTRFTEPCQGVVPYVEKITH
ncbi:MAG: hypothetical protein JXB15_16975 [Anaerolineales bacterium]|nr:hypothetical protein [Anaerolineales bacterium]